MARVIDAEIKEIIDTTIDTDPFIEAANLVVTARLANQGIGDDLLKEIERWFAAHLVAIRDTESGLLKLYANGNLIESAADSSTDISQDEDLYFGYNIDNDMYLKGALDDVRLYNYALSDSEIDSLYKLGIPAKVIPVYTDNNYKLSIYPNPAGNIMYLKYKLKEDNDFTVNIYSLSGQAIKSIKNNDRSASGIMEINTDDLAPGVYFLQFINNLNTVTKKIYINH